MKKWHIPLRLYRLLAAALCLYGQWGAFGVMYGHITNWNAICYFTNLSNLLCLAAWVLLIIRPEGFPRLHGMAAQAILLTMVVYHTVLSSFDFTIATRAQFNNHVVHTFVPLLMIVDFLFLRKRDQLRWYSPFSWTIAPLVYFVFALLMPTLEEHFFPRMTRFPYFFLSPYQGWLLRAPQGYAGVFLNCAIIFVAYVAAGYVMYGIYGLVCRMRDRKAG